MSSLIWDCRRGRPVRGRPPTCTGSASAMPILGRSMRRSACTWTRSSGSRRWAPERQRPSRDSTSARPTAIRSAGQRQNASAGQASRSPMSSPRRGQQRGTAIPGDRATPRQRAGRREGDHPGCSCLCLSADSRTACRDRWHRCSAPGHTRAAQRAFSDALSVANALIEEASDNLSALDTKGLALCGLALVEILVEQASCHDVRAARAVSRAPGIVGRVLRTFDVLVTADELGILDRIRGEAAG